LKRKNHSTEKEKQIHREQINAFRNRIGIVLSQKCKHDATIPDPITSFQDIQPPSWWWKTHVKTFQTVHHSIVRNIENGKWINPTPIQMQAIPSLLSRRDVLGCAPTGSGKSGAFLIPLLFLTSASDDLFYATGSSSSSLSSSSSSSPLSSNKKNKNGVVVTGSQKIRALVVAPSRELACQLHREVERLGEGKVGGIRAALLSKSNAGAICANSSSDKSKGLDVLVSTPLRLVECLLQEGQDGKKLDLGSVRIVILDEADRLLDASDGNHNNNNKESGNQDLKKSGSLHVKTFLEQMDTILSHVPSTATRALFSATIGSSVRHLAESILRNEIDISTGMKSGNSTAAGVNHNVSQSLMFVGKEEGKLLAIRQIIAKGITPPVIIFLQSKERAQALFLELMYDNIRVDVIHAGKSQAARDAAVARFRKGDSWVLICTDLCARGLDFKAVNMVINYDLPTSGVTYVHRIGRCGRGGRKGEAITLFTEQDFEHLRTIANIMKLSGCDVPEWMLSLKGTRGKTKRPIRRKTIDTTPSYDKKKRNKKNQCKQATKKRRIEDKATTSVEK
jgi:Superfamily II DNA and RNA helicases